MSAPTLENATSEPMDEPTPEGAVGGPALDMAAVHEHLSGFHDAPGLACVWSAPSKRSYTFQTDNRSLSEAAQRIRDLDAQGEESIYVQGTTLARPVPSYKRGTNDNVAAYLAIQHDVDYGKELDAEGLAKDPRPYAPDLETVLRLLDKADLPPRTKDISSGHGVYPVWEFDAPVTDVEGARRLAEGMAAEIRRVFDEAGYRLDKHLGKDPARLWRVPGTVNRKREYAEPAPVHVLRNGGPRYKWTDLRATVPEGVHGTDTSSSGTAAGTDRLQNAGRDRVFTTEQAKVYVRREAWDRLRDAQQGHNVNDSLYEASYVVGHFVRDWFLGNSQEAEERIAEKYRELVCVRYGWPGINPENLATLRSGLNKGISEPYTLREETPADEAFGEDAQTQEERDAQALADAVRKERIRVQAREIVAAERLPAAPPLEDLVVWDDNLESIPPPQMAVPALIPERAVGWIGGPSGSYKSFVAVSLGLSLAYGAPALESRTFTPKRGHKVLYVAGEGSSGVGLRSRAMRHRAGITRTGRFGIYPYALDLGSPRDVERLAAFALKHEIDFIVVDTWRQSTPGVNEIDNTDVGVILRRLLAMRDEHGISALLVDHTNKTAGALADLGGAGAKRANADFVLMIDLPNGSRDPGQQRTLRVAKLKDGPDGKTWPIRLESVPEVVDADGRPSAVAVVGEVVSEPQVVGTTPDWGQTDIPDAINQKLQGQTGAWAARDILRVLIAIDDPDGLTMEQLKGIVAEGREERGLDMYGKSTWSAAFALLKRTGVNAIQEGRTSSKWVATDHAKAKNPAS